MLKFITNVVGSWNAGGFRSQGVIIPAGAEIVFFSGMRGIDPTTQQQLPGPPAGDGASPLALARFNQIYTNIAVLAQAEGMTLQNCVHLFTTVTNAAYIGPIQNAQTNPAFWGSGPYPARTVSVVLQMSGSDTVAEFANAPRGDIAEVQAVFARTRWHTK